MKCVKRYCRSFGACGVLGDYGKMRDRSKRKYIWVAVAGVLALAVGIVLAVWMHGRMPAAKQAEATTAAAQTQPEETTTEPTTEPPPPTLTLTAPTEESLTVQEPFITIKGTCDVSLPLTVNGQAVTLAQDGTFSYDCPLKVGKNIVTVTNTDRTVVLHVTYERKLIRSVSPKKSVYADGGMKIEVSAQALAGAKVTVSLAGVKVSLSAEDSGNGEAYRTYSGVYTLPAGKSEQQKLGHLKFTAAYDGQTETVSGASVIVNAIKYEEIPIESGKGEVKAPTVSGDGKVDVLTPDVDHGRGKAKLLLVTADYAETCPGDTADDKSSPLCTPFLKGTYDYIAGEGVFDDEAYYITQSGYKVEKDNAQSRDGFVLPSNTVSVYKSYTDDYTTAILTMNWKTPFVSELKPQTYRTGYAGRVFNVTGSTAQYIDFKFYYTNAAEGTFDFSGSNTVSRAEWINIGTNGTTTLRVHLKRNGKFYGYRAYYASDNRLVIQFRNAPKSLSDTVVVIDPGHGGKDPGAIGTNGMHEAVFNLRISALLKQNLEAAGVQVKILRTSDTYIDLEDRRRMVRESGADVFVCMHNNSSTSSSVSGTEVYYYRAYAQPLAKAIHAQLVSAWQGIYANDAAMRGKVTPSDGGVRWYPFQVTRIEECPAVLVECGYLSNAKECAAISLPANQERIAKAVCQGVLQYLKEQQ